MEEREQVNGITQDIAFTLNSDLNDVRNALDRIQLAMYYLPPRVYYDHSSDESINHLEPNENDNAPRYTPSYDEKVEWLRKKGALNRLLRNLSKRSHLDKNARRIYIDSERKSLISSGFVWRSSDEGQSYWEGLDASYREWYLRKIR